MSASAQTRITDLRIQNAREPLAIEDRHPVFSWKMESGERGAHQTAYRICVVRESDGSTLWDSGKVADWVGGPELKLDASSQVVFGIRTDFRILKGRSSALILGVDDLRLKHSFFNPLGTATARAATIRPSRTWAPAAGNSR